VIDGPTRSAAATPEVAPRTRRNRILWLGGGLLAAAVVCIVAGAAVWFRQPPTPRELFERALSGLDRGDVLPVTRALPQLEVRPEFVSHARLLRAVALLRTGQSDAALGRFAALRPTGELREPILFYTAQALHASNRLAEAELLLHTLVKEHPANAEARRWLGIVYYDLGAYDAAIVELQELAKLVPDDYRPHRLIGLMCHDFEQEQEAVDSYRQALTLAPPNDVRHEILQELAQALVALRRYDEAKETIAQARPTAVLESLAAQCLWSEGQPELALEKLEAARRLDPAERTRFLLEAEILATRGDRASAIEILREAVRYHPHDAECHYRLGLALRDAGETDAAEAELAAWKRLKELATELSELNFKALGDPHDLVVRERLADVCEALGKKELAAMWRQTAESLRNAAPRPVQGNGAAPVAGSRGL